MSTSDKNHSPIAIIGSGCAGLTAAIYASRAALPPLVIEGMAAGGPPGGQLSLTSEVENYPGFPKGIHGPEMMALFQQQAERFGTKVIGEDIARCDFSKRPFTLHTAGGAAVQARAVILATGATANWLGLENELRLARQGGGVSACAVCDGALPVFRNQRLCVVGGGDTALEEATYLTKFATRVNLIHRRDRLRGSKAMQERAMKNEKMAFQWNRTVEDILTATVETPSGEKVEKIRALQLRNTQDGSLSELPVQGLFVAIGHKPNTELFAGQLEMDETGYLKVQPGTSRTGIPGVFAAGDVQDHVYRQAITAAGSGCMAAIDCERWLAEQGLAE